MPHFFLSSIYPILSSSPVDEQGTCRSLRDTGRSARPDPFATQAMRKNVPQTELYQVEAGGTS